MVPVVWINSGEVAVTAQKSPKPARPMASQFPLAKLSASSIYLYMYHHVYMIDVYTCIRIDISGQMG